MKRRLDVCRNCHCFRKWKVIPWEMKRTDHHYHCHDDADRKNYRALYECIHIDEWEKRDVPNYCVYYAEYLIEELNG